jgi:hypothetical protein
MIMAQQQQQLLLLLLLLLQPPAARAAAPTVTNAPVMIDMVQNNPGDPVGWEQTKYFDPKELKKLCANSLYTPGGLEIDAKGKALR